MSDTVKVPKVTNPRAPKASKKKQSAVALGVKQTARITSRRAITSTVNNTNLHPALKLALISGIGALISHFISKR